MPLLFDEDYKIMDSSGLEYEENCAQRFLIIKNFPLSSGMYVSEGKILEYVEILWIVPHDYNTSGGDMFWVHPALCRADGKPIPCAFGFGGQDSRNFQGKEYCRWSRHWNPSTWKPKTDNIEKVLARFDWALRKPETN